MIKVPRFAQITDSHCGPAVIQMMLAYLKIELTQQEITKAAGITRNIRFHGSRIDHFDKAIKHSAKQVNLWYKDHAKLKDLICIIDNYKLPVAIEWQGLFGYKINPKTNRPIQINDSHYSLVTNIDQQSYKITVIDPYKTFFDKDRIFSYNQLRKRWWDANDLIDKKGEIVTIHDYKLLFFIAPKNITFPTSLGLKPASAYTSSLPL